MAPLGGVAPLGGAEDAAAPLEGAAAPLEGSPPLLEDAAARLEDAAARLEDAEARMEDPDAPLLGWGLQVTCCPSLILPWTVLRHHHVSH